MSGGGGRGLGKGTQVQEGRREAVAEGGTDPSRKLGMTADGQRNGGESAPAGASRSAVACV